MKVRYIDDTDPKFLIHNNIYEVLAVINDKYLIIDESNDRYCYPKDLFQTLESWATKSRGFIPAALLLG